MNSMKKKLTGWRATLVITYLILIAILVLNFFVNDGSWGFELIGVSIPWVIPFLMFDIEINLIKIIIGSIILNTILLYQIGKYVDTRVAR